jgi:hypothetical protein
MKPCPCRVVLALLLLAAPASAQDFADRYGVTVVTDVKADLVRRGISLSGPCGAFQITGRVAWQLRDRGLGLVGKTPAQNGCTIDGQRYSVDAVVDRGGNVFDILINSETDNAPAWQFVGVDTNHTWRAPVDLDPAPAIPDPVYPVYPPTPAPAPLPSVDLTPLLYQMETLNQRLARVPDQLDTLIAKQAADTEAIRADIRAVKNGALELVTKYLLPALGGLVAGWVVK